MGPARGGRSRTVASRARWKVEDALDIIKRSRDEGYKRIVKGGIARLSFGPDGPGDDDDTFWVWDTEELLPNGGHMVAVRKATFDERWPYTGRRGWRPTSNKLSEAGFHFTPTDEDEDGCTCVYCGVELGGWERTDDPVYVKEANKRHEHQRRRPECPFFHCIVAEALQEDDTSKKRVTSSKDFDDESFEILPSKKRSTMFPRDILQDSQHSPTGVADEDESHHEDPITHVQISRLADKDHHQDPLKAAKSIPTSEPKTAEEEPVRNSQPRSEPFPDDAMNLPVAGEPEKVSEPDSSLIIRTSISGGESDSAPVLDACSGESPLNTHATETSAKPDIDEDEAQVESLVPSATEPPTSSFSSIPDIQDYLPYPFPHRHSSIDPPAVPDPHKMTVLEWITQQQNYLLDTMKERIERRLASMRQRNLEERKRLEKTLRS